MCGIAGVVDWGNSLVLDEALLQKMAYPMRFRGPDQEGVYVHKTQRFQVGLAHKRLSIIDLSETGRQPMHSHDQNLVIVFNGEIYNYPLLKTRLVQEGYVFRSTSDTEVILNAYRCWGMDKTLDLLEGMFAFALVDKQNNRTYLARDRFGEKPLYYHQAARLLAFGSDIRSFYALNISKTLDPQAVGYYFSELGTGIENSIYAAVKKLPPAHYLVFDENGPEIREYWALDYRRKTQLPLAEAVAECATLLEESVRQRLVSDVPVGCFLSGGIDSSLVSLFAARNYGQKLQTFSVGFGYEPYNELPHARLVAQKIASEHHEIVLNPNDIHIVDALLEEYGEPFADSSQIPTHYVSQFAASHVKVVMGGDGGDELFAGYRTYNQGLRMQQWYNRRWLKPFLQTAYALTKNEKARYLAGVMDKRVDVLASALYRNMGFSQDGLARLLKDPRMIQAPLLENEKAIRHALQHTHDVFDTLLYGSIKTRLVNDYFVKTDRAAMFNSLELRTPFVDRRLAEFVASLPYSQVMHGGINKYITKKIAEAHFPHGFIYRPKQGFGIPVGEWIKKEWKNHFLGVMDQRQTLVDMDYAYVQRLINEHMGGQANHTDKLWAVYVFHRWASRNRS